MPGQAPTRISELLKPLRNSPRRAALAALALCCALGLLYRAWSVLSGPQAPVPAPDAANPDVHTPAALLARCRLLAGERKKEEALDACQAAVHAAEESAAPADKLLGCDASLETYKLLSALGRKEEAGEVLFWAVQSAPPAWAGLPEARGLLRKKR